MTEERPDRYSHTTQMTTTTEQSFEEDVNLQVDNEYYAMQALLDNEINLLEVITYPPPPPLNK